MPDSIETVGDILDRATPSIGHNGPPADDLPLAEQLAIETAALQKRADSLIATAGQMQVTDDESCGKAATLVKMIKDHAADIEKARKARKEPVLEAGRTIDGHFNAMAVLLIGTDPKKLGGAAGPLDAKIDELRRKREAEAAAEKRRLEEEARKQREAAAEAERARLAAEAETRRVQEEADRKVREAEEAARAAGDKAAQEAASRQRAEADAAREKEEAAARERGLQAEIDQRKAEDAAADLERQAAATKAAPIDSGFGVKASGRKTYRAEITDLTAAIKHSRKVDEASIRAAVEAIYKRQVNAGVRTLPGATVHEDSTTTYR
jgi:hypothetical protein